MTFSDNPRRGYMKLNRIVLVGVFFAAVCLKSHALTNRYLLSDYPSLLSILEDIGDKPASVVIDRAEVLSVNNNPGIVPSTVSLKFTGSGTITLEDNDLAIQGSVESAIGTIFRYSGSGRITLSYSASTVYPQWFGAVGDGIADDTAAIQYAVDACAENGAVLIPEGSIFRVTDSLHQSYPYGRAGILINKAVNFGGKGKIRVEGEVSGIVFFKGMNRYIERRIGMTDMTIEGDHSSNELICILYFTEADIRDITVLGGSRGIHCEYIKGFETLKKNRSDIVNISGSTFRYQLLTGILLPYCPGSRIMNCEIGGNGEHGIYISIGSDFSEICECFFWNDTTIPPPSTGKTAIHVNSGSAPIEGVVVSECKIDGFYTTGIVLADFTLKCTVTGCVLSGMQDPACTTIGIHQYWSSTHFIGENAWADIAISNFSYGAVVKGSEMTFADIKVRNCGIGLVTKWMGIRNSQLRFELSDIHHYGFLVADWDRVYPVNVFFGNDIAIVGHNVGDAVTNASDLVHMDLSTGTMHLVGNNTFSLSFF